VADLDRRDGGAALMERARDREMNGDVDGAVKLYQRAIDEDPDNALAHLDVGILLHDQVRDHVGAIYHYRRYLALRPDTEKKEMIEYRIRVAEQLFAAQLLAGRRKEAGESFKPEAAPEVAAAVPASPQPPPAVPSVESAPPAETTANWERQMREMEQAQEENEKRVDELESRNAALNSKLEKMDLLLARTRAERDAAREALVAARHATDASASGPSAGVQNVVRTYRVKRGDTLSRIAAEVYGDAGKWERIYRANAKVLGGENRLRVGQVLVIP
jgi:tetratricopeptide (TPR) repeat protein